MGTGDKVIPAKVYGCGFVRVGIYRVRSGHVVLVCIGSFEHAIKLGAELGKLQSVAKW